MVSGFCCIIVWEFNDLYVMLQVKVCKYIHSDAASEPREFYTSGRQYFTIVNYPECIESTTPKS